MTQRPRKIKKPVKVTKEQQEALKTPETRDYTAERNGRVLPFVKKFLSVLGEHPFTFQTEAGNAAQEQAENESQNRFYEQKFIPEALKRDLRMKDMPYAFALAKSCIEMLQNRSSTPKAGEEMRVLPAALEILAALGAQPKLMILVKEDEAEATGKHRSELYDSFYHDIVVPVFMKHEVAYHEVNQVFAIMIALIDGTERRTAITLKNARNVAEAKLWNVEDTDDLTIRKVHEKCIEKTDAV